MPISKVHHKKKVKNYTLLAIIVCLMAFFFALTMVKISMI